MAGSITMTICAFLDSMRATVTAFPLRPGPIRIIFTEFRYFFRATATSALSVHTAYLMAASASRSSFSVRSPCSRALR